MSTMNRMANIHNKFQGNYRKVLCVCSAGLLRSPSAAIVLSQEPFFYNTRAAGADSEFALIPVDKVLLEWADEIVCMQYKHFEMIASLLSDSKRKNVIVLDIEDIYEYRQDELMKLIKERYIDRR